MSEKRRLGKGLGALIPEVMTTSEEASEIALEKIKANPYQPRRTFDQEKLEEMAASIREHGVLQAVLLAPSGDEDSYFLVAGERRCRAANLAGLKTVPAVVKPLDRKAMLEIALIENIQREDLNPVEEAHAYKRLMQEHGYTQEELAKRIGKSRPSIANSIRLLALPEKILTLLASGVVTAGQVRPLLSINDPIQQGRAADQILNEGLSAREVEKMAAMLGNDRETAKPEEKEPAAIDPLRNEIELQIQRVLGTKVKLKAGRNGGSIEIYYYSDDDLERLVAKLLPEGI